jgi:propanol-preferring alcohol dehydrogenase
MKAMVLHEHGKPMILEEVPIPEPGRGEVLVSVRACGLGLTLVWNRNGRGFSRGGESDKLPRIIGHEVAGDVVDVGPGVFNFKTGDRVIVYFYLICGNCRWCRIGREDLCDNHAGYVGRQIDGGLAEYIKLPARNLCPIPPELGYVDGAVAADAIATPMHVLQERARLKASETVLILGAGGGVGIHMVQMARALGGRVIAVDISADKLALAREWGADETINGSEVAFDEEALRLTGDRGVDVVVEIVGTRETMEASVRSLGKGGRLVFVGTYDPEATVTFNPRFLVSSEIILTGSRYCSRHDLAKTVEMVARGRIRPVVTRTCRLEEADEVLRMIEHKELAGRAAVVMS